MFTRWDGKGVPEGIAGEQIAPTVRLFHVADSVEVIHRTQGLDAAVDLARAWRGTQFAPDVVDAFSGAADEVLTGLDDIADWDTSIVHEPGLQARMTDDELDSALEAMADFTDLRSPSRAGHSRAVAGLSARAAELAGLPPGDVTTLRRAALVHDLGMNGLPATILDKPGPLTPSEAERMRMHAYYTDRMLARPPALGRIGAIAALATERLNGSGYHRGLSGASIPATGRILAAADAFQAMREPRPYRQTLSDGAASDELRAEVRAGRLAADAVDAVLAGAGQRRRQAPERPRRPDRARGRGARPDRPRRLEQAGRRGARDRPEDRRHPHRTHLLEDRRLDPLHGHAVRDAAGPARLPRTARFVGRSPDDIGRRRP